MPGTNTQAITEARKLFGIEANTPLDEIRKKYLELARQYHPDRCAELDNVAATAKFQKIQSAWELLEKIHTTSGHKRKREESESESSQEETSPVRRPFFRTNCKNWPDGWRSEKYGSSILLQHKKLNQYIRDEISILSIGCRETFVILPLGSLQA